MEPDGDGGLDCAIARLTPAASNAAELSALSLPSFMMIPLLLLTVGNIANAVQRTQGVIVPDRLACESVT
jgi:hypothetical protein